MKSPQQTEQRKLAAAILQLQQQSRKGQLHNPTLIQQVLEDAQRLHQVDKEAVALRVKGDYHRFRCEHEQAISTYNQAIALLETIDDDHEMGYCLHGIGITHWQMGSYDLALEAFGLALKYFTRVNDSEKKSDALNNIGVILGARNHPDESMSYLQQALEIREQIGDLDGVANSYLNISNVAVKRGEHEQAIELLNKAKDIYEQLQNLRHLSYTLVNIGYTYLEIHDGEKALPHFERAAEISKKIRDSFGYATALNHLGQAQFMTGRLEQAKQTLLHCVRISRKLKNLELEMNSYRSLTNVYKEKHLYKKALYYHQEFSKILEALSSEASKKRAEELRMLFEAEKKEREAEIYRLRNIELVAKQKEIEKQQAAKEVVHQDLLRKNQELTESYQALQKAQKEIIELERVGSVYATAVTTNHELNQPLMILSGNLELLIMSIGENELDVHQKLHIRKIDESLQRIKTILERLRTMERVRFENYSSNTMMVAMDEPEE